MVKPKIRLLFFLVIILLLAGCQMNRNENEPVVKKHSEKKEEELPKTRAFQNAFTRGFIASTDEVENGYYAFTSKTGHYTMLFPEDGSISKQSYSNEESKTESFLAGIKNKGLPNASLSVSYNANTSNTAKGLQYSLKFLKSQADMKEPFHQKKTNDSVIYWSTFTIDQDAYGYGAYIHPSTGKGGIEMIYSVKCDSAAKCVFDKEVKNQASRIFSSIRFDHK
ncbi:hypothetical protein [Bacillus sp. MUM 13]|uniref:hypothetical protein n=1 Tax=Bacillus sp. MUM 13 TaxID=1678001 RepID=UPI0008F5AF41|nr:hypothetical protein [Bacillus sp. MUM 13]OIK08821.1 hypothetical protein BIV59_18735 [Bacillus sp. MUM 13]